MELGYVDADPLTHDTPLLAVGIVEGTEEPGGVLVGLNEALGGQVARALSSGDMKGRSGDEVILYGGEGGPARLLLLGLGKAQELDQETVRRTAGRAVRVAERLGIEALSVSLDAFRDVDPNGGAQAAAEGAALAAWKFRELKTEPEEDVSSVSAVDLLGQGDAAAASAAVVVGAAVAAGENLARTLQARPGLRCNGRQRIAVAKRARRVAVDGRRGLGSEATIDRDRRLIVLLEQSVDRLL